MSLCKVIIPAAAIVAIGGGIGLADMMMRNDRVTLSRKAPPPPEIKVDQTDTTKPPQAAPASDAAPTPPAPTDSAQTPAPPSEAAKPAAAGELPAGHLTIAQSKALFDQGSIFIDARRKEVYVEGHVAGAFRADMASFKSGDPAWLSGLPKDLALIVYCNGGDCDESEHVAQLLDASGFQAVYVMHDGFPGWKAAGHPTETGEGME